MSFKKLAGVDPERAEHFKKALGSNKELDEVMGYITERLI